MYDLRITNGLILDGTGSAPYRADAAHVAVNGVLVVEDGAFTGRTPGQVIRDFGD